MTTGTYASAAEAENADYEASYAVKPQDLLVYAAKSSGRSVLSIQSDFRKLRKSAGRLTLAEFVRYGLFRPDRLDDEKRAQFMSNGIHWQIANACCKHGWNSASEDKVLADTLLRAGGVPVPEAVAVIDRSSRLFPGIPKVETAEELRDLVLKHGGNGLFGKIVDGMVSFGAFQVEAADTTHITCHGHDPMTYEAFLTDFIGDNPYLVQKQLVNHSGFAGYASALATVRMCNLVTDNGIKNPVAVIKLPQGGNVTDAFWRPGNLACEVDVDTGRILTVASRNGVEVEYFGDHPSIPGLMGLELPHWDKLKEINTRAARIFAPLRYQSTDIAITPDGPVMIELNYGGSFDLLQNGSGRGLLTPEVREFFESCGYDFDAIPKRRRRFFGRRG